MSKNSYPCSSSEYSEFEQATICYNEDCPLNGQKVTKAQCNRNCDYYWYEDLSVYSTDNYDDGFGGND